MCAEVILLQAYGRYAAGSRVTLAANVAISMVRAGQARWP